LASKQFQSSSSVVCPFERHFTPDELGKLWHVAANTVRRWCDESGGVLAIDRPEQMHKRGYKTLRIPESTATRIYAQHFAARRAAA
jgi:hypothetical protein